MTNRSFPPAAVAPFAVLAVLAALAVAPGPTLAATGTPPDAGSPAASPAAAPGAAAAEAPPATLYERLGGVYPIAAVVDAFIERLLVDETLNANPAIDAARRRVPKEGLKFHVTTLLCQAAGGPCRYVGRDMQSAHAHLGISEEEWRAMIAALVATLDGFGVPAAEQGEILALVEGTKGEIVVAPVPGAPAGRASKP